MKTKKTFGEKIFDVSNAIVMVLIMMATLYPFIHVICASISNSNELMGYIGPLIWPKGFSLAAYRMVFKNPSLLTSYKITLIVVIGGTMLNILITSLGAYVLSRKNLYWKKPMMIMVVFTMFFHGGLIPNYLLINNTLHMGNNLLALIIPGAISTWNLIVMRTSFMNIPDSLEESAKIDGANDFTVLFKIIIPLSTAVIAVMVLFYGVSHWNSWFSAMLYMRRRALYPLQLILREILIQGSTDSMMAGSGADDRNAVSETVKYATIMVATIPILLVYPFIQRYFMKGVMVGAVKG